MAPILVQDEHTCTSAFGNYVAVLAQYIDPLVLVHQLYLSVLANYKTITRKLKLEQRCDQVHAQNRLAAKLCSAIVVGW